RGRHPGPTPPPGRPPHLRSAARAGALRDNGGRGRGRGRAQAENQDRGLRTGEERGQRSPDHPTPAGDRQAPNAAGHPTRVQPERRDRRNADESDHHSRKPVTPAPEVAPPPAGWEGEGTGRPRPRPQFSRIVGGGAGAEGTPPPTPA